MSMMIKPDTIHVCPLNAVDDTIERVRATHLMTLINKDNMIDTPAVIAPDNHLRVAFNDICEPLPGYVAPGEIHVARILEFGAQWDRNGPMLIHCWAGISRSTAGAFMMLCQLNPRADEFELAHSLRRASPTATPNALMVSLADRLLERQGRMIAAINGIGRGELATEGRMFSMPAGWD